MSEIFVVAFKEGKLSLYHPLKEIVSEGQMFNIAKLTWRLLSARGLQFSKVVSSTFDKQQRPTRVHPANHVPCITFKTP
jgi:hypothetical protein